MNSLIIRAVEFLMRWCEKRGRVLKITGTAGPDDVYLIRYFLVRSRWMNIYIHQFLRSDRDDLHDHPWHFITYLVRGMYVEAKWDEGYQQVFRTRRANLPALKENVLVFRKATDQHQVIVGQALKEANKEHAPLTLFISGPKIREWGFVKMNRHSNGHKWREWTPWREYLGLPADSKDRG